MKNIEVVIGKERGHISFEGTDYLIGNPYSAYLSTALGLKKSQLQLSYREERIPEGTQKQLEEFTKDANLNSQSTLCNKDMWCLEIPEGFEVNINYKS